MGKPVELIPGAVVGGDFRIVESLSAGGMGVLYVAEQLSTGKKRALKVMQRKLLRDRRLRERFVQEARIGALIESDHVVEVIGAGIDETTDLPWIALELLDGEDLGDFVDQGGSLPGPELVHLLRQLCHALGAAHEAGVVHRDVKPENVFLARSRSAAVPWTVKVLDFGIAKVLAQARGSATAPVGSPAWMAPEQTESTSPIAPTADVWSLGLLTFWLLTGRPYWLSANDEEASVHGLMREVLFEPLRPASERAGALGVDGTLPADFDRWFARCVAREPAARFPDASAAFAALEEVFFAAGFDVAPPVSAARPSFDRVSTMPLGSEREASRGDRASALQREPPSDAPSVVRAEPDAFGLPTVEQTAPMAPAQLSATAAPTVTRGEPEDAPSLPMTRRWAQLLAVAAVTLLFAGALLLAVRSAPSAVETSAPAVPDGQVHPFGEVASTSEPPPRRSAPTVVAAAAAPAPSRPASTSRLPTPNEPRRTAPPRPEGPSPSATSGPGPFADPPDPLPPPPAGPPAAPTPPLPTTDVADGGAPGRPPEEPDHRRPFDPVEAQLAVQRQAGVAAQHCRNLPGPRVVTATVVFGPSGRVERVAIANHRQSADSTTSCVKNLLSYARVRPYRGDRERVSTMVPLL